MGWMQQDEPKYTSNDGFLFIFRLLKTRVKFWTNLPKNFRQMLKHVSQPGTLLASLKFKMKEKSP